MIRKNRELQNKSASLDGRTSKFNSFYSQQDLDRVLAGININSENVEPNVNKNFSISDDEGNIPQRDTNKPKKSKPTGGPKKSAKQKKSIPKPRNKNSQSTTNTRMNQKEEDSIKAFEQYLLCKKEAAQRREVADYSMHSNNISIGGTGMNDQTQTRIDNSDLDMIDRSRAYGTSHQLTDIDISTLKVLAQDFEFIKEKLMK